MVIETLVHAVQRRANWRCEYCHLPYGNVAIPFEMEHAIAKQHGGSDAFGNRAFACLHCNRHKGPNLSGIDRITSRTKLIPLFNPRKHVWDYHFRLDGPFIVGRTSIGRVTVQVLQMNDPLMVVLREQLIDEALFPLDE